MKKIFIYFALLAGIAVMTGCKKDQDVVTLKAITDSETKAYFGTFIRPYWDGNDKVRVMGGGYSTPLTCNLTNVSETFATIANVQNSTNHYFCAIYPVKVAEKIGTPAADGTTQAVIYYNPSQKFIWENGRQRVNMPMGAVTDDNDKTFYFKNLCSILRLKVTNNLPDNTTMKVRRITVQAYGAYVAGSADVTLTKTGNPVIEMDELSSEANNVLSVFASGGGYMKTLANGVTDSFDIVVPPFNANKLAFELEIYDGDNHFIGNSFNSKDNPGRVDRNQIKVITVGVQTYQPADYAYLESGPLFNQHMHDLMDGTNVNQIMFSNNGVSIPNPVPEGWIEVQAANSPIKIYAHVVGTDVRIESAAPLIYADTNCREMFKNLTNLSTVHWNTTTTGGFQTEDVTDMAYMFYGCTNLSNPNDIYKFNTTNVRNMSHMFEKCTNFNGNNLNLSTFNTHNLQDTGMVAMFKDCPTLATLNLSSFSTRRVTSMKDLFNGCVVLKTLHIDNFDMSNVSNAEKARMFKDVANNISYRNPCIVYCPQEVQDAILAGDGAGNYYSGLDESSPEGNYYLHTFWDGEPAVQMQKRRIQFERP